MNKNCNNCSLGELDNDGNRMKNLVCESCEIISLPDEVLNEERSNWTPKDFSTYCENRYNGNFNVAYALKDPFKKGKKCQCGEEATIRIDVNIIGTVFQLDVCQKHAIELDGKTLDAVEGL